MDELFYSGAVGMVETRGFTACAAAADAMLKAAPVRLAGREQAGQGLVTVVVRGETGAVRTAVEKGAACAERLGRLVTAYVIPKPHGELSALLPREL